MHTRKEGFIESDHSSLPHHGQPMPDFLWLSETCQIILTPHFLFHSPPHTHTHSSPESSCLRNREVVRAHRKRSHISLKEYTDKQSSGDLGRFGELMCLLTPLFEVSTEVTEQLRLEHFVHEGEARIDALLLMSMINGSEEVGGLGAT